MPQEAIPERDKLRHLNEEPRAAEWEELIKVGITDGYVRRRNGWTRQLLRYSRVNPYGKSCGRYSRGRCEGAFRLVIILLIASGPGVVAQLPYLNQLAHP